MNRDDIIRMAREAGLMDWNGQCVLTDGQLEHFTSLVAAAEREACAKVCESIEQDPYEDRLYRSDFADAIRARSKE